MDFLRKKALLYNTSVVSIKNMTPFHALFGRSHRDYLLPLEVIQTSNLLPEITEEMMEHHIQQAAAEWTIT